MKVIPPEGLSYNPTKSAEYTGFISCEEIIGHRIFDQIYITPSVLRIIKHDPKQGRKIVYGIPLDNDCPQTLGLVFERPFLIKTIFYGLYLLLLLFLLAYLKIINKLKFLTVYFKNYLLVLFVLYFGQLITFPRPYLITKLDLTFAQVLVIPLLIFVIAFTVTKIWEYAKGQKDRELGIYKLLQAPTSIKDMQKGTGLSRYKLNKQLGILEKENKIKVNRRTKPYKYCFKK